MNNLGLFKIGTKIRLDNTDITGTVIGHRLTRVIVKTDLPLPVSLPIGTMTFDDFTIVANPTLLSKIV